MLQINDDDGYIQVQLGTGEPKKLDLFLASDVFASKLSGWQREDWVDYYSRLKDAANVLELGELTNRSIVQVWQAVQDRMEELKKKEGLRIPTL